MLYRGMFNSKNFQREIFCRSSEIFVGAGSFDNYKALPIMHVIMRNNIPQEKFNMIMSTEPYSNISCCDMLVKGVIDGLVST